VSVDKTPYPWSGRNYKILKWLEASNNKFIYCIISIFLVALVHLLLIFFRSGLPIAMLYGPLAYAAYLSLQRKPIFTACFILNIVLFVLMSIVYTYIKISWGMQYLKREYLDYYYVSYFLMMIISTAAHSILPLITLIKKEKIARDEMFLLNFSYFSIFISILSIFILTRQFIFPGILNGFDVNMLINLLLFVVWVMTGNFIWMYIRDDGLHLNLYDIVSPVKIVGEDVVRQNMHFQKVDAMLSDSDIFCDPEFSVSVLANKTGIPRFQLTNALKVFYDKNFYQVLAERRIQHAKAMLESDVEFKIEVLSQECGFKSKSAFNRYFKEIVGVTPKEYKGSLRQNVLLALR